MWSGIAIPPLIHYHVAMTKHPLPNPHIHTLALYQPGKSAISLQNELGVNIAQMANNENPLGASKSVASVLQNAMQHIHLYPDGEYQALKKLLANKFDLDATQITLGNGSENILELIIKAFLPANANAIISEYTFLTIPILIKSYNAQIITVPTKHFHTDLSAMLHAINDETRMIFLVNPNNPTGTYIKTDDLLFFLKSVPSHIIIVIDEAYCEYITEADFPNTIAYLQTFPNLIITRTFSKAYGLANLRLGYAMSSSEIADIMNRARLPYNVSTLAMQAGIAALNDQQHIEETYRFNLAGKKQLETGLTALNFSFIPSVANFITVNVHDAKHVAAELESQGILVRPLNAYNMPQFIRVSIGSYEDNARFLQAL